MAIVVSLFAAQCIFAGLVLILDPRDKNLSSVIQKYRTGVLYATLIPAPGLALAVQLIAYATFRFEKDSGGNHASEDSGAAIKRHGEL